MEHFNLSEEESALAGMVREFAEGVVAPQAYEADRTKTLNMDVVAGMGELGLFGLPFPEEVGGQGGDYFALCLALEALGRVDQSVAITLEAGVSLGAMPIHLFGTAAQKEAHLPDLLAGRALAGFGLTEPEAGSDAGATRTTARPMRPLAPKTASRTGSLGPLMHGPLRRPPSRPSPSRAWPPRRARAVHARPPR